jgi:4,5-DOPA dioxygenase extradiol
MIELPDSLEIQEKSDMPVLFVGHGNPMNALSDNAFTQNWRKAGHLLPKPEVILSVSAHWLTRNETRLSFAEMPETIHDFDGFPYDLESFIYPAPGAPEFARQTAEGIGKIRVVEDDDRGLDHGTWAVLCHMFPMADIPVYQMSMDYTRPPEFHYELAGELRHLRRKGVLIMGTGNPVHNLKALRPGGEPYDWALEFDQFIFDRITAREFDKILDYSSLGETAKMAHPAPDHFLPLLYTLGAMTDSETVHFFNDAFDMSSVSMRSFMAIPSNPDNSKGESK